MKKKELKVLLYSMREISNKLVLAVELYNFDMVKGIEELYNKVKKLGEYGNIEKILKELEVELSNPVLLEKKVRSFDNDSIIEKLERYYLDLLNFGKINNLINFKDYLDIKIEELNFYISGPLQSIWFNIQEEVDTGHSSYVNNKTGEIINDYKKVIEINKLPKEELKETYTLTKFVGNHPFGKEILKYNLDKIFLDGSDYCDQDLASEIINNLEKIKKNLD